MNTKSIFLIVGDLLVLYLGLFLTLILRYDGNSDRALVSQHFFPFSIMFVIWLIVFYIAGLYDFRRLRNNLDFLKTLGLALFVNALLSVLFFYLIPAFGITPKTNLFIFLLVFGMLETVWRRLFNRLTVSLQPKSNVIFIGAGDASRTLFEFIKDNPQFGYEATRWLKENELASLKNPNEWHELIRKHDIDLVVIPRDFKKESDVAKMFYQFLTLGIQVQDLPAFYETIFRKIPLSEINETWFLDELMEKEKFYDDFKRGIECVSAALLGIILLPFELLIALLVKCSSRGPAIYKQMRVGERGREFILYKFRTMRADAEKHGPKWAEVNDKRTTFVGRVLRYTHLDELPQLVNIIKGDLSFVGPRPERPEFVGMLREKILYYDIRHLIKPGVTGWAQIEYRYGASVEDAAEKLAYDIYYIKNRSLLLDAAILLKTFKLLFVNQ